MIGSLIRSLIAGSKNLFVKAFNLYTAIRIFRDFLHIQKNASRITNPSFICSTLEGRMRVRMYGLWGSGTLVYPPVSSVRAHHCFYKVPHACDFLTYLAHHWWKCVWVTAANWPTCVSPVLITQTRAPLLCVLLLSVPESWTELLSSVDIHSLPELLAQKN